MAYKYGIAGKYTAVYIRSIFGNAEFSYAKGKRTLPSVSLRNWVKRAFESYPLKRDNILLMVRENRISMRIISIS